VAFSAELNTKIGSVLGDMDGDAARAREAVRVCYETPSARGAQAAAVHLQDLSGKPGGCEVAWALLDADASTNTDNTRFWGATTLLYDHLSHSRFD
jgi:hypothetical protein